jgi:hypothetical protein
VRLAARGLREKEEGGVEEVSDVALRDALARRGRRITLLSLLGALLVAGLLLLA